jgi:hypothetical protein
MAPHSIAAALALSKLADAALTSSGASEVLKVLAYSVLTSAAPSNGTQEAPTRHLRHLMAPMPTGMQFFQKEATTVRHGNLLISSQLASIA